MTHYYINGKPVSEREFLERGGDKSKAMWNGALGAMLQLCAFACLAAGPIGWIILIVGIVVAAVLMTVYDIKKSKRKHQGLSRTSARYIGIFFLILAFTLSGCGRREPSIGEIERGIRRNFIVQTGVAPNALDVKVKRVGEGRWAVCLGVTQFGVHRTLNARAVMDKNGDIHYYTD